MNDYELTKEAESLAREIWAESQGDENTARDLVHEYADGHELAIYYGKALDLCATCSTDDGEQWLEDCGGIAQPGDSFGNIACRIAFAELYCRTGAALETLIEESEG